MYLNICDAGDRFISLTEIYGGSVNLFSYTLKRLGIAIIRKDLIMENVLPWTPTMLRYKTHADKCSLYNTHMVLSERFITCLLRLPRRSSGCRALLQQTGTGQNGTSKGRKRLRMDRTAQHHKGVCKGDCERGNYSNVKDKGGENLTLIFVKQCNFNVKMTVLKIALKPFHHACGHQASFSVGKMDDSIFSVNFFYIIFVYQKCPMATHKIAVQYAC